MSSTNHRHTYYGGTTTITIQQPNNANPHNDTHLPNELDNKSKRKKYPTFGAYLIGSTLGEGEFGKVKLGWSKSNSVNSTKSQTYTDIPKQVAIKLIKRDTIVKNSDKEIKIYREINALKQLNHPNIVKLDEVLQNSKYIGIVLEYASGGEFYKYIQKKRRLKEQSARRLFAQLISGVSYIHSKGLVHRDLKLENLLLDKNENLIITDFGFVNEFYSSNELMKTSCGSPCYAAPELVTCTKPYEARKADIWSCGIILFAMLAGYLPWDDDLENPDGNDIGKLYHYITHTALKFPEYINPLPRDLLRHILVSDPKKRVTSKYIKEHKWLSPHLPFLSISSEEWDKIALSKNVLRLPKHKKKQNINSNNMGTFSKPRPLSTCSTSSTGSNGEKRDSLIMDSTLLSFPVPPRESQSHVMTMPSPPSPEIRNTFLNNTHSRSNSAASIALQAVVDAEREIINQRRRTYSSASNITNLKLDSTLHSRRPNSSNSERNIIYNMSIMNTTTAANNMNSNNNSSYHNSNGSSLSHSGGSSLLNKDNVIIESPVKGSSGYMTDIKRRDEEAISEELESSIAELAISNPVPQRFSPPSHNLSQFHSHLARTHRKPRPTSYQPGSFPTVLEHENPEMDIISCPASNSNSINNIIMEATPFDSIPKLTPNTTVHSNKSLEISPKLYPRRSFSIKSKISLDVESVSGDLIKSSGNMDSTIKKLHEQVDDNILKPIDSNEMNIANTHTRRQSAICLSKKDDSSYQRKRFSLFPFYSNYHDELSVHENDKENISVVKSQNYHVHSNHTQSTRDKRSNNRHSVMGSNTNEFQPSLPTMREHPNDKDDSLFKRNSHRQSTTRKVINFFKSRSMRL